MTVTRDGYNSYTCDPQNQVRASNSAVGQINGSDTILRTNLYDGDALIGEYAGSGAMLARYVHGLSPGDDPIVAYSGASTALSNARFLHGDRLGSIVLSSRTQGASPAAYAYDEYGIHGSVTPPRFGYTGQVLLPEAGLYYYKARMYSPNLGRFMQPDPLGYGDGMNMYAYVGNNPVNRVDPSGLRTCTPMEIIEGEPLPENAIRVCGDRPRVNLSLRRGHGGCEPTDGLCIVMLFHPKPQYIGGEGNEGVSSSPQNDEPQICRDLHDAAARARDALPGRVSHPRVWNDRAALRFFQLTYQDNRRDGGVLGALGTVVMFANRWNPVAPTKGAVEVGGRAGTVLGGVTYAHYDAYVDGIQDRLDQLDYIADGSCQAPGG